MKRIKRILVLALMVLLAAVVSAQADCFDVRGRKAQVSGAHPLFKLVEPGATTKVTVDNGLDCDNKEGTGYINFLVYITGFDGTGEEKIVGAAYSVGTTCKVNCTITIRNSSQSIHADEVYVVAAPGQGPKARAAFEHELK